MASTLTTTTTTRRRPAAVRQQSRNAAKVFSVLRSQKSTNSSIAAAVKPKGRGAANTKKAAATKVIRRQQQEVAPLPVATQPPLPTGTGLPGDPFRLALREAPNASGCLHCTADTCPCLAMTAMLADLYQSIATRRITEVAGSRHLCAKSLLPPFVSRLVSLLNITAEDTFYDLGSGDGSILLQVACMTGARCVGVELSSHNAALAREAVTALSQKRVREQQLPPLNIEIVTGDIGSYLSDQQTDFQRQQGKTAILTSNLLFPKPLTHYMSEQFRRLPAGCRVCCFDDLYPHGRSIAAIRDPEAFQLFRMEDYMWQEMSVEWCSMEGKFYLHWRR